MTRKEAIRLLTTKRAQLSTDYQMAEVYTMAIKALEQESVLDKIRVEIESYDNFILCANGQKGIHIDKALEIIDKYKAESEEEEMVSNLQLGDTYYTEDN